MPSATARTAAAISRGGVSLSRKPAAPAASAAYTYSSTWNVVRTATCGGSGCARICLVAVSPSITGIRMSISTTSGRSSPASATARAPSPASPTTSKSAGRLQHRAQAEPDELLVVHEQDRIGLGHAGSTASTPKPPSSRGSALSRPPRVRTRSPNPTRP